MISNNSTDSGNIVHDDNCCLWYVTHTHTCVNVYVFFIPLIPSVSYGKKIDIGKWIFCCCRCYMHVHVYKCDCEYYVRLHWSVYNHVKRREWKFSSIDSNENTWKIQSLKPFMLCYGKRSEIYIHANYVKMFEMRFHKQSSSIWLRISNDNAKIYV